jgi:hypothetical protein
MESTQEIMGKVSIEKFLDSYSDLFQSLSRGVSCPACGKFAHPPFANLGKSFHWAEGHPGCVTDENTSKSSDVGTNSEKMTDKSE